MVAKVFQQMVKRHIVADEPPVLRRVDLHFLGDAGTDKGELVTDAQLLAGIDRRTHQRRLYRHQHVNQLRLIFLDVVHHNRAGLGYTPPVLFSLIYRTMPQVAMSAPKLTEIMWRTPALRSAPRMSSY